MTFGHSQNMTSGNLREPKLLCNFAPHYNNDHNKSKKYHKAREVLQQTL
jgi:hypothetical protein